MEWTNLQPARLVHSESGADNVLLRQLSYAIKTQLKAPKTPFLWLCDETPPTRGIYGLYHCLYGHIILDFFCPWMPPSCHRDTTTDKNCPKMSATYCGPRTLLRTAMGPVCNDLPGVQTCSLPRLRPYFFLSNLA